VAIAIVPAAKTEESHRHIDKHFARIDPDFPLTAWRGDFAVGFALFHAACFT
jgi:hypothetical protein